ncbi:predicted protein [Naegleria gruberi]|uniref:Predicted protein n=1 Tax=Naegleria gruberi TaxID=5762 RepID=D2W241_NAEGR|nr:uncharacterized protein NAEGRDRAFT_75453 [Naegleria gruberi]EFC36878.1 predicted protein [Naegleria gruberi]|eukprot:XP_002669622.1 predicted protein [Naegleria gruberi strain NEG-M]
MYSASFDKTDFPTFHSAKNRYVIAQVVNDVSNNFTSANEAFWNSMFGKGYAYPKDEYGKNLTTGMFIQQLPRDILSMRNDPYRALSYYDRSYGGYGKTDTSIYFVDFVWGNFLREFGGPDMSAHLQPFIGIQVKNAPVTKSSVTPSGAKTNSYTMKEEFKVQKSLIGAAVAISKSSAAKGLPGYMQGTVDPPYCLASYQVVSSSTTSGGSSTGDASEKKKKIILLSDNLEDEEYDE